MVCKIWNLWLLCTVQLVHVTLEVHAGERRASHACFWRNIQNPLSTSDSHNHFLGWTEENLRHLRQTDFKETPPCWTFKCLCGHSSFSQGELGTSWWERWAIKKNILDSIQSNSIRGRNDWLKPEEGKSLKQTNSWAPMTSLQQIKGNELIKYA